MSVPAKRSVAPIKPDDPAELGFPATLPFELAMRVAAKEEILAAYNIGPQEWEQLRIDPLFRAAVKKAAEEVQKDGVSYRMKAKLQAEALLETSWQLIHHKDTPSAVKADLIKFTARVAGYDAKDAVVGANNAFQININLG
jgi:hypothetical protein